MKYIISKTDGTPVDSEAVYFVLRVDKPDMQGLICRTLVAQYAEQMKRYDPEAAKAAANTHREGTMMAIERTVREAIKPKEQP